MSAEKCGGFITFEMIQSATKKAAETSGKSTQRIISYRANSVLKKIQHRLPDWDHWTFEAEIWFKARSLGIMEEE